VFGLGDVEVIVAESQELSAPRDNGAQPLDALATAIRCALDARAVLIATPGDDTWTVRASSAAEPPRWRPPARLRGIPDLRPGALLRIRVARGPEEWQLAETSSASPDGIATVDGTDERRVLLVTTAAGARDLQTRLWQLVGAAADVVRAQNRGQRDRLRDSLQEREDERRRWARELHDETLQQLGALQVLLTSVRQRTDAAEIGWQQLRGTLDQAVELVSGQIGSLRHLINELRPAALDELGLRPPLEALAERTQQLTGMRVDVHVSLPYADGLASTRLLPDVELAVYRVVQEALTNAARHSGGTRIVVRVVEDGDRVRAEVIDDGIGACRRTGFGIDGMRERAELAGGRLDIGPGAAGTQGCGTTVRLVVPALHRPAADSAEVGSGGDADS
jgi:signal transduction histidine kinase